MTAEIHEGIPPRWPPFAYVPGGPWPHPKRSWMAGVEMPASPIVGDDWWGSPPYLTGIAWFNAGYYWEAHEAWEALWHAHGRRGPTADTLKALIKLAAAGVKVREGRAAGVATHARRAADLFRSVAAEAGPRLLGLDLLAWADWAGRLAEGPIPDGGPREARVVRVFPFEVEPQ